MTNFPNASDEAVRSLFDLSKDNLFNLAEQLKIENLTEEFLAEIVTPISLYLDQTFPKRKQPYFICFTGGQGSGKTTLSFFIQKVLNETVKRPAMGFSIDDIYKSQEDFDESSKMKIIMFMDLVKSFDDILEWHEGDVAFHYKRKK